VICGNSGFEVGDDEIQFGPLICENYSLVPKLWKKYRLVPGA